MQAKSIIATALCTFLLSGCGTNFFRNRNFDYLHQSVKHEAEFKIPNGLSTPNYQPTYHLPPGPNSYPAQSSVVMTPPNFNKNYTVHALPHEKKAS